MNYSEAANLLRAWRASTKVSQAKLARAFGIAQPAIALWERRGRPDLANAIALQAHTGGAVPASAWGYPVERIARVLDAASIPPAAMTRSEAPAVAHVEPPAERSSLHSNDRAEREP